MKDYIRKKPEIYNAIQYNGEDIEEFNKLLPQFCQLCLTDGQLYIKDDSINGDLAIKEGYYIVFDFAFSTNVFSERRFLALFQEVNND